MVKVQVIDCNKEISNKLSALDYDLYWDTDDVKALFSVESNKPAVVLLNYNVRAEQTAEYVKLIHRAYHQTNIIIIADQLKEENILGLLVAGANGYQEIGQLGMYAERLIQVVNDGEAWITRQMVSTLLDALRFK